MAAHQPNFLPFCGFFDKMMAVNELGTSRGVFVLRVDCQFVRKGDAFHNRNKVRTPEGWKWLHVPVEKAEIPIKDVSIKVSCRISNRLWNVYHLRLIEQLYKKAPYFDKYFPGLEKIYSEPGARLGDFNTRLIKYLIEAFGIKTKVVSFCDLPPSVNGKDSSETLANIARHLKADVYLSGDGGEGYLDLRPFGDDVEVKFQEYKHPVYPQRFDGFQPFMSAIDALLNIGFLPRSGEVIR